MAKKKYVYVLTTFRYNAYLYNGVAVDDIFVHATLESANIQARHLKCKIVSEVRIPEHEVTIDKDELLNLTKKQKEKLIK